MIEYLLAFSFNDLSLMEKFMFISSTFVILFCFFHDIFLIILNGGEIDDWFNYIIRFLFYKVFVYSKCILWRMYVST